MIRIVPLAIFCLFLVAGCGGGLTGQVPGVDPGSGRAINLDEEVPGNISEAGDFEPWLLHVDEEQTVNIYMCI